ncbi:hypothetical protein [Duganella sp. Root1480D1]|uniref:hypothetical protein n=1 Tax=Duganella sp. Root1480D1 TaxID=1736471 RepID=UPI000A4F04DB|nr:hypothetical protein [Duganella sp. Root1480D1]
MVLKVIWAALRPPARAAIGALLLTGLAHAQTTVSGPVRTNQTWGARGSPYMVDADVAIEAGAVLTIEPGVTVRLGANANLVVSEGALRAVGTVAAPIVLTASTDMPGGSPAAGAWGNVSFLEGTSASTRLEWVQVNYGKGILIQGASPVLNYVDIRHSSGAAVQMDLRSSPSGVGLQASGNAVNGISVPAGDISGSVQWNLRGIPYVVAAGEVSVGARPKINAVSPTTVQQGDMIDAVLSGSRLAGAESVTADAAGVTVAIIAGASDSSVPVRIAVTRDQPAGKVNLSLQTAAGLVRLPAALEVIPARPTVRVSSMTPSYLRVGTSAAFQMTGTYLNGANIALPQDSGMTLSDLVTTETTANFKLTAVQQAPLGEKALLVTNATAPDTSATVKLSVVNGAPAVSTDPAQISIAPNAQANSVTLRLSSADVIAHDLSLALDDPDIATVSPARLTIPAGAQQATVTLSGLKVGTTMLTATSPTLATIKFPVYVGSIADGTVIGPIVSAPVDVKVFFAPNVFNGGVAVTGKPVGVQVFSVSNAFEGPTTISGKPIGVHVFGTAGAAVGEISTYSKTVGVTVKKTQ